MKREYEIHHLLFYLIFIEKKKLNHYRNKYTNPKY